MPSFRCSPCNLNWPPNNAYTKCPRCSGKTSHMTNPVPMTASETNHVMFEIYAEAWDKQQLEDMAAVIAALPEVERGPANP